MKKIVVLLLSLVLLVSLSCPIFASAVQVEYPSNGGETYRFVVGTTGGGAFEEDGAICLLSAILYFSWDEQFPSMITVLAFSKKIADNLPSPIYGWLTSASSAVLNTVPVTVPSYVITNINSALRNENLYFQVPTDTFAFNNLSGYTSLNLQKSSTDFFLTESEYNTQPSSSTNNSSIFASIRDKVRDLFLTVSDGFQNIGSRFNSSIDSLIDSLQTGTFLSTVTNGFRDINDRFLDSFKTMGNQLYAIRDRISEGDSLGTIIKNGFQDIFKNSWIGQKFEPDNFEDESFNQYDKFLKDLEDDRQDLLNKIDSFEIGFAESIEEITSALIFVSMVFGVFSQIPFLQTVFNVSLALGMTATVLGLVPMIADRFTRKKGEYK